LKTARKAWWKAAKGDPQEYERRTKDDFLSDANEAGELLDFHALRHRFITSLDKSNVSMKTRQSLARHSSITLTMDYLKN